MDRWTNITNYVSIRDFVKNQGLKCYCPSLIINNISEDSEDQVGERPSSTYVYIYKTRKVNGQFQLLHKQCLKILINQLQNPTWQISIVSSLSNQLLSRPAILIVLSPADPQSNYFYSPLQLNLVFTVITPDRTAGKNRTNQPDRTTRRNQLRRTRRQRRHWYSFKR